LFTPSISRLDDAVRPPPIDCPPPAPVGRRKAANLLLQNAGVGPRFRLLDERRHVNPDDLRRKLDRRGLESEVDARDLAEGDAQIRVFDGTQPDALGANGVGAGREKHQLIPAARVALDAPPDAGRLIRRCDCSVPDRRAFTTRHHAAHGTGSGGLLSRGARDKSQGEHEQHYAQCSE
jgi:hypothetical protein